jgi:hypothetical protein
MDNELDIKKAMCSRLNSLLDLDSKSTLSLLNVLFMFDPSVHTHEIETSIHTNDTLIADFLGLINGLVGNNNYRISLVKSNTGQVECFDIHRVCINSFASLKQLKTIGVGITHEIPKNK